MAKNKSRGNGEGTIYKVRDNYYRGQVTIGRDNEGKLIRKNVYGKTKKEVKDKIRQTLNEVQYGTIVAPNEVIVKDYIVSIITEQKELNLIGEDTYNRKEQALNIIKKYSIADMRVQKVTEADINAFLKEITNYSQSVIKKEFGLLKLCFSEARRKGIIAVTPMEFCKMPKSTKQTKKIRALTLDEQKLLTNILINDTNINYREQMLLMLFTGMRMGEINALNVDEINVERKEINISKTITRGANDKPKLGDKTKTYSGMRTIPINNQTLQIVIKALELHKSINSNLLFYDTKSNNYITTQRVNTYFKKICEKNNIIDKSINGDVTLHSLRHTYATRCIEAGMPAKVLQKLLGHKDIKVTLNTYCDAFEKFEQDSLNKVDIYLEKQGIIM